jgi:hypothetical protein
VPRARPATGASFPWALGGACHSARS